MTALQNKSGFQWTKVLWGLTLMIWIALFSYKAYDKICSKPLEVPPANNSKTTLPEPTPVQTLPVFDKNWKGYGHSKTKIPRIKEHLE